MARIYKTLCEDLRRFNGEPEPKHVPDTVIHLLLKLARLAAFALITALFFWITI